MPMTAITRFLYWITERHKIHILRMKGDPKPWTDDLTLQRYFFTNPYRENDKTTVWFRETVRHPLRDNESVLFATICFRWFNLISTGNLLFRRGLLDSWNTKSCVMALELAQDRGEKVFTGAFNISNSGSKKPKINRVCEDYIASMWRDRTVLIGAIEKCTTMQNAHRFLMQYMGMGGSGFMSYEVICDLRYTYLLTDATDKETWSNPGPGAKRGLNRVLGRALDAPMKDWRQQSTRLLGIVQSNLPDMPKFEMREVEHSLCEFDKYERARLGDGHLKRRYDGA